MQDLTQIPARREFKYLVERARVPALRDALRPWCERDPHAGEDGTYALRSLYFDSPDLMLFHANEREAPRRFKARVRTYPEGNEAPVFAEIKFRSGDVIHKTRTPLPAEDWRAALRPGGAAELDPFLSRVRRHDLRPTALVEYRREAWVSRIDAYGRVSIDFGVQCQAAGRLTLDADPRRWRPVDHPLITWMPVSPCVVELKWADYAPSWMVQLVQRLDLLRHSFSKYCYSMQSLADDHYRDYRWTSSTS